MNDPVPSVDDIILRSKDNATDQLLGLADDTLTRAFVNMLLETAYLRGWNDRTRYATAQLTEMHEAHREARKL